jgi:hypothetical protein
VDHVISPDRLLFLPPRDRLDPLGCLSSLSVPTGESLWSSHILLSKPARTLHLLHLEWQAVTETQESALRSPYRARATYGVGSPGSVTITSNRLQSIVCLIFRHFLPEWHDSTYPRTAGDRLRIDSDPLRRSFARCYDRSRTLRTLAEHSGVVSMSFLWSRSLYRARAFASHTLPLSLLVDLVVVWK